MSFTLKYCVTSQKTYHFRNNCIFLLQLLTSSLTELICNNSPNWSLRPVLLAINKVGVWQTMLLLTYSPEMDASIIVLSELVVLRRSERTISRAHLIKLFEVTWVLLLRFLPLRKVPGLDD